MTLYELTGEYLELEDLLEEGEVDSAVIQDKLGDLSELIESKIEGYMKVYQEQKARESAIKAEIDRLKTRKDAISKNTDSMKNLILTAMQVTKKKNIETDLFSLSIRNTPPKLVVDDEDLIPDDYIIPQPGKVDAKKLKEYLKGLKDDEDCDFAHLESGQSLVIE